MIKRVLALLWLVAANVSVAAGTCSNTQPKRTAFYTAPSQDLSNTALGTIIDWCDNSDTLRTVFAPTVPSIHAAYKIKYVTTNAQGVKTVAITTLLQPENVNNNYVVSYQPAYDSADLDCSPSYQLGAHQYPPANNLTEPLQFEQAVIALALQQSYWVNVPDYEGLTASFTSGPTAAYSTLDSLVAVQQASNTLPAGPSSSAYLGLIGYSGGSLATEWASELQAKYAPALSHYIAAIVIGGLPVDISKTLVKANGAQSADSGSQTYLIPNALQGLASAYPAFAQYLYSQSRTTSLSLQQQFNYSMDSCHDADHYTSQDIFSMYLGTTLTAFTNSAPFQSVLATAGIMGRHGAPTHPTYIFQGYQDEVVDQQRTTDLVNQYCGSNFNTGTNGASVARTNISIQYILDTNPYASHAGEALLGLPAALNFLQRQFQSPTPTQLTGCSFMTTQPPGATASLPTPPAAFHNT